MTLRNVWLQISDVYWCHRRGERNIIVNLYQDNMWSLSFHLDTLRAHCIDELHTEVIVMVGQMDKGVRAGVRWESQAWIRDSPPPPHTRAGGQPGPQLHITTHYNAHVDLIVTIQKSAKCWPALYSEWVSMTLPTCPALFVMQQRAGPDQVWTEDSGTFSLHQSETQLVCVLRNF